MKHITNHKWKKYTPKNFSEAARSFGVKEKTNRHNE